MSFTHQLRLGGSYSLDTHIRFQPPFKIRVMKLTKQSTTPRLSSTEKDSGLQVPPPSPMKPTTGVVRQGAVRVKEDRVHPRNWFSKIRWLVLCEKQLSLHPSQTKALKASILLSDIKKLERTDRIPYGLVLQTKNGRRYLLSFESDNDLYDWQDDISVRSMGVGLPYNFVHETHSTFNPSTGAITGLPEGWDQVLFNKFGPGETEPQISLVIRVPGSNVPYEWRVQSSAEKIQDILTSVCNNMGLRAAENVLTLVGDPTPLTGSVADLLGKRELEIVTSGATPAPAPSDSDKIFIRVKIDTLDSRPHIATTILVTRQMEIQNVLQVVCRKTKLEASRYMLILADRGEALALDRTVADLNGNRELVLVERAHTPVDRVTATPVKEHAHTPPDRAATIPVEETSLRVNLRISPDETYLSTVSATPQMQLQDVLQRVCSKMKFQASDYVLAISGSVEPLEMNLTVASLEAKHELVLVKRSSAVTRKSLADQL